MSIRGRRTHSFWKFGLSPSAISLSPSVLPIFLLFFHLWDLLNIAGRWEGHVSGNDSASEQCLVSLPISVLAEASLFPSASGVPGWHGLRGWGVLGRRRFLPTW